MSIPRIQSFPPTSSNGFDDWVAAHEHDGFYLTFFADGTSLLHRAGCRHRRAAAHLTHDSGERVCSTDRHALQEWAAGAERDVRYCDCF